MKRRFRFSLHGFLIAVAVFASWLGWTADAARKQCEAVAAIKAAGGKVLYDWEERVADWWIEDYVLIPEGSGIPRPERLRSLIGDDFFQNVTRVVIPLRAHGPRYTARTECKVNELIVRLNHLRKLNTIYLDLDELEKGQPSGAEIERKMKFAFPRCDIVEHGLHKSIKPAHPTPGSGPPF